MNNGFQADRRISRRDILKLGAGAVAASAASPILAACGGQPSGQKAPSSNAASGDVTFWTTQTDIYLQAQQHSTDTFNASHKVQVKLEAVPAASVTDVSKLLTAVRGGTGPDVYMLDRFTVAQQAATGTIENLSQYVNKESDLPGQYLDYAWKEVEFKGRPYGLPYDTDVRGMYYNKTMLRELGFNPSELDISKGPITVSRMHDINTAANQTAANGNYTRVGIVPWFSQGLSYTWGYAFGGSFANLSKCQVTPTNHGVVQAYQFIYDWAKEFGPQKLASFISAYAPLNAPPATDPFFVGRTALELTGDWQIAAAQKYVPNLDYGITYIPVPKAGNKPSTWSGGWSLVIPQGAKNPDGAWEFMRYMCGVEGQRYYTTSTAHLPTWKSLLGNKGLYNTAHQLFVDHMVPITKSRPPLPVGAKYWDELQSAFAAVALNSDQPQSALQAVDTAVNPQLQHFCPLT